MINRRLFSSWLVPAALTGTGWAHPRKAVAAGVIRPEVRREVERRLQAIEAESGGRLGVCIVDTASGAEFSHRPDELFRMCSTFKLVACARVLQRVDLGIESLDRRIAFTHRDLVAYSPVTSKSAAAGGMTLGALCEATLTTSDNTAANLILASYGGPQALTAFLLLIGDDVTRLDRIEPEVNAWRPGDPRDTTSPRAMLGSMRQIVLGDLLMLSSREQMQRWLLANTTGAQRLRHGLPPAWRIGDKTGKGDGGANNDIGVVWPPDRAPLLVTAYLSGSTASDATLDEALSKVGETVAYIGSR